MSSDIFFLNSSTGDFNEIISSIEESGGTIEYKSPILPIIAFKSDKECRDRLEEQYDLKYMYEAPIGKLQYDDWNDVPGSLSQFTPLQIVPPVDFAKLRQANCTGWGVTVAVLDSGISEPWVRDHKDFTGFGPDPNINHGDKVANIIKRFCRGSILYSCKVTQNFDDVKLIDVLNAINFAVNDIKAKVINLSLGFAFDDKCDGDTCPLCQHVNAYAQRDGVVFVAAAGNRREENKIDCPGKAPEAITVGAVNQTGREVAAYSSKGVSGVKKPNILSSGSIYFNQQYSEGTSYATPIVSGVSAAIMSADQSISLANMKDLLYTNATNIGASMHHQGFGVMNLDKMLEVLANATVNSAGKGQGKV